MNNYLGRLIARSRGELPTLQPRLPGRFESTQDRDLLTGDATATTATPVAAETALSPPVIDTLRRFVPDRPVPEIQPSAVAVGTPAASTRPVAMPQTQAPSPSAPAAGHGESRVIASPAPSSNHRDGVYPMRIDADQTRSVSASSDQTATAMATAATAEATAPAPASSVWQAPATLRVSPQVYAQRPQANSTPQSAKAAALHEPHETVVHVTIGRIDVRAVAAPTAKSAPRQESPRRASLDDYLRGTPRR